MNYRFAVNVPRKQKKEGPMLYPRTSPRQIWSIIGTCITHLLGVHMRHTTISYLFNFRMLCMYIWMYVFIHACMNVYICVCVYTYYTDTNSIPNRQKQKCMLLILTIGPSSRPLAPSNWEPGLFIARTGTPVGWDSTEVRAHSI